MSHAFMLIMKQVLKNVFEILGKENSYNNNKTCTNILRYLTGPCDLF